MKLSKALLGLSLLLVTGCGKPPAVKIDSSEATDFSQGNHAVGLLEVHNVNTGDGFGIRLQETTQEGFYCTVSVVNPNTVVTSTDCLQTIKNNSSTGSSQDTSTATETSTQHTVTFDPKDMTVYLPVAGQVDSKSYGVTAISGTDGLNHLAYLRLDQSVPGNQIGAAISLQSANKPLAIPTSGSVSGYAVSATPPDANGISHLRRSSITLRFTAGSSTIGALTPPTSTSTGTGTSTATSTGTSTSSATVTDTNTNTNTNTNTATSTGTSTNRATAPGQAPSQSSPSSYSLPPQAVTVSGLKDGSFGAPVFYSGTMVGIVQNASTDNVSNGQWIVSPTNAGQP